MVDLLHNHAHPGIELSAGSRLPHGTKVGSDRCSSPQQLPSEEAAFLAFGHGLEEVKDAKRELPDPLFQYLVFVLHLVFRDHEIRECQTDGWKIRRPTDTMDG